MKLGKAFAVERGRHADLKQTKFLPIGMQAVCFCIDRDAIGAIDPQMRNAFYGYSADPSKASRAGYMREFVMPGMARLLHRPAYDFTQPYEYNRTQFAFGCYHCHRVS